jgi:hypothetical protein
MNFFKIPTIDEGGVGSGNWGHKGLKGVWGGSSRTYWKRDSGFVPSKSLRVIKKGKTYNLKGRVSAELDKVAKSAQRTAKYRDAGKSVPKSRAKDTRRKRGEPKPYSPYDAVKTHDLRMEVDDILSFVRKAWRPKKGLDDWRGQVPKEERRGTFIRYYDAIKARNPGGKLPEWESFHAYMTGLYSKLGRPKN